MEIVLIAAIATNRAIGMNNELLWHLPDDFKHFKTLTSSHYIIMGRKTFESFPKPLPNRTHVILTRDIDYNAPSGCLVVHSLEQALEIVKEQAKVYVIGGAEIYSLFLNKATQMELTIVNQDFEGDAFFPEFDQQQWNLVRDDYHSKDERHAYSFCFKTYVK